MSTSLVVKMDGEVFCCLVRLEAVIGFPLSSRMVIAEHCVCLTCCCSSIVTGEPSSVSAHVIGSDIERGVLSLSLPGSTVFKLAASEQSCQTGVLFICILSNSHISTACNSLLIVSR